MSLPKCHQPRKKVGMTVCFDCELSSKCTFNAMPGQGPRGGIMIVGEKPTPSDVERGQVFAGLEHRKLSFLLDRVNMHREAVYLTYAVKCDMPKKTTKIKKYASACLPHLIEEIEWVKPKVIITLGTTALSALVRDELTADDYRGFPIPLNLGEFKTWVIPTYSMTQAIGNPGWDPIFVRDLKLAKKIAKEGYNPPPIDIDVRVLTDVDSVKELVGKLHKADEFSFDLETKDTDFIKSPILCHSFSMDGKTAYVVPHDHKFPWKGDFRTWNEKEKAQIEWLLKKAYVSPAKKTAQNGKFDKKFLLKYGMLLRGFDFDTMLAHHLIDSDKPHDLLFIAQWYDLVHQKYDHALELEKRVHGRDDYSKFDPRTLYYYAGIDAGVTQQARPILQEELIRTKTNWVFNNISIPQTHLLADMEYHGAKLDLVGMNRLISETDEKIRTLMTKIKSTLKVEDYNPNSTKQLGEYLEKHRVDTGKRTPGGKMSLDEEAISPLAKHPRVGELISATLEARSLTKLKGTYLDGTKRGGTKSGLRNKMDENHFIHTEFLIHGTYTGRLSSKNPNLQNIPKDFGVRQLFIADEPGDILMSVDYKQLEVRVAAAVSKDPVLIKEILAGVDMHSRNAAMLLLNVPEAEFMAVINDKHHPKHKKYAEARRAAKAVTFGVLYGSTAHGVAAREKIDIEICEKFIAQFFRKYKVLAQWIKQQHQLVRQTSKVKTPTGRFIRFHDLEWANSKWCPDKMQMIRRGETERVSVNMPIQGMGSDIFQYHKIKVFKYLKKKKMKSRLVLSLHDGFVMNVKPNEREELTNVVPLLMHKKLNEGTRSEVPLDVDLEFGRQWEGKDEETA